MNLVMTLEEAKILTQHPDLLTHRAQELVTP